MKLSECSNEKLVWQRPAADLPAALMISTTHDNYGIASAANTEFSPKVTQIGLPYIAVSVIKVIMRLSNQVSNCLLPMAQPRHIGKPYGQESILQETTPDQTVW